MEMSEHVYELLKNEISMASGYSGKFSHITPNARFLQDVMGGTIILEIKEDNGTSSNISFYANLKNFFKYLSAYDEDQTVKAYLYLKGVTEEITNEELFSQ